MILLHLLLSSSEKLQPVSPLWKCCSENINTFLFCHASWSVFSGHDKDWQLILLCSYIPPLAQGLTLPWLEWLNRTLITSWRADQDENFPRAILGSFLDKSKIKSTPKICPTLVFWSWLAKGGIIQTSLLPSQHQALPLSSLLSLPPLPFPYSLLVQDSARSMDMWSIILRAVLSAQKTKT